MADPSLGVRIDVGPQPFQILQQDERGFGSFTVSGRWGHPVQQGTVQLRVVAEVDCTTDCAWQPARRQATGEWEHAFEAVPVGGPYRLESRLVVDPNAPEWGIHGGYGANPPCHLRDAEGNTPALGFYGLPVTGAEA
jgi:hypothetical protein